MSRKKTVDPDNPEWTRKDFERARPPQDLPEDIQEAFRRRGPQKAPRKVPVSLRLSREVVERFKADGPGWQSRIDQALRKAVGL